MEATHRLVRPDMRWYSPPVVAPPPALICSDRSYAYQLKDQLFDTNINTALHGLSQSSLESEADCQSFTSFYPFVQPRGIFGTLGSDQLPRSTMQVPQLSKLILDSGKLAKLDSLLKDLRADGHRVLLYFQMTRMIDLMEEYLSFRQFKYLRLDGSS